jgi:hypothetical protein
LTGQRRPASIFMSAQQVLCWTGKTDSPGRTGVKEARLSARTASNSRVGNFITDTLSQAAI